ncbi:MAG: hypothetical protein MZW92_08175 [Comamonadaceae bacterium]|nr:hypothetical protein [Comamonadaceae bacterium]
MPALPKGNAQLRIDDGIQVVDEIQVLVEQHPALKHTDKAPGSIENRCGRMDNDTAIFNLPIVRLGIGCLDDQRTRKHGEPRLDRLQLFSQRKPRGDRAFAARQCRCNNVPLSGNPPPTGDVDEAQESP